MTADIMPVFAGGLLETAARAFEREPVDQWLEPEILEGIGFFVQLRSTLRGARKAVEREVDQGVEARGFVSRYQPVADGLARFFAVVSQAREALRTQPGSGALSAEVAAAEAEGQALRDLLSEVLQLAATPMPSIDWKKLEEQVEADRTAGRMIPIETFDDLFGEPAGDA